ncbi:MAG: hypothetical protein WA151_08735 [Desulfatirhabdiaceae bacterium]
MQVIRSSRPSCMHSGMDGVVYPEQNIEAPQSLRQTIIKKATAHVIRRIYQLNGIDETVNRANPYFMPPLTPMDHEDSKPHQFIYHRMDSRNRKTINSFSITDSIDFSSIR